MSLADKLNIKKPSASSLDSKDPQKILDDLQEGLNLLGDNFLSAVKDGEIKIHDIKDAKDVVTIVQTIKGISNNNANTPEITPEVADVFNSLTKKDNQQVPPTDDDVDDAIAQLDEKGVEQLIADSATARKKANLKE